MKKLLVLVMLICGYLNFVHAQPPGKGQDGNGGGGIIRSDQVLTFGSAGVKIQEDKFDVTNLKSFQDLLVTINNRDLFSDRESVKLAAKTHPSASRVYKKADANWLSPEKEASLKAEYAKTVNISRENIVLYAVTSGVTTVLLPNFFKLNELQQQVILFHENLWVLYPNEKYEDIVAIEIALENYLTIRSRENLLKFLKIYRDDEAMLKFSVETDLKNNFMSPLVKSKKVKFIELFGPGFVDCVINEGRYRQTSCMTVALPHITQLITKYPNSYFLKALQRSILNDRINFGAFIKYQYGSYVCRHYFSLPRSSFVSSVNSGRYIPNLRDRLYSQTMDLLKNGSFELVGNTQYESYWNRYELVTRFTTETGTVTFAFAFGDGANYPAAIHQ